MIRAVLFDLEETLSDYAKSAKWSLAQAAEYAVDHDAQLTTRGVQEAYHRAREEVEREAVQVADGLYATQSGVEVRHRIWERALQRCGVVNPLLARAVAARYGLARAQTISLFPDALPVLGQLKARHRLGLVANGPADIEREQLKVLGLVPSFAAVIIEGEVGYGKPAPQIFQLAAEKVDCQPCEAVFVGDSLAEDVAGAKGAGMRAVWVNRSEAELSPDDPTPEAQIVRLSDLPEVIDNLSGQRAGEA